MIFYSWNDRRRISSFISFITNDRFRGWDRRRGDGERRIVVPIWNNNSWLEMPRTNKKKFIKNLYSLKVINYSD